MMTFLVSRNTCRYRFVHLIVIPQQHVSGSRELPCLLQWHLRASELECDDDKEVDDES